VTYREDTIAAVATAPGEAGIAVVRVSGPRSLSIADRVFKGRGPLPSSRLHGSFVHGYVTTGAPVRPTVVADEVVLLIYRAPRSYTREDVVEFQGHGGRVCTSRVLRAVIEAGARLAEPGEFTRRAFLNGRIDLLQAEAVADLIRAQSDRSAAAALEQLEGRLSVVFGQLYDELLGIAVDLEASLDFPDEELPAGIIVGIPRRLASVRTRTEELLATWHEGRLLREGAMVVICGLPNAGKSSLMNSILGTERSIVTELPGTTRDTIEEYVILDGIKLRIVDTAGIRKSDCIIEQAGVGRATVSMAKADLVLFVTDASAPATDEERALIAGMDSDRVVLVLNKADLCRGFMQTSPSGLVAVQTSMISGKGIDQLKQVMTEKISARCLTSPTPAISERHRQVLTEALGCIVEAKHAIDENAESGLVLCASSLRSALEQLGSVVGKTYSLELLDSVFSKFCIGK